MKKIIASAANQPHSIASRNAAWILAGLFVLMAVGQLYGFEKFIPLIEEYALPGGYRTALLVASVLVATEVLALPFLLRMPLSPLMRWTSLVCSLIAVGLWAGLGIIALGYAGALDNSGMLGVKVSVPVGAIQLIFSAVLVTLAVWSASGLWPSRKK